MADLDISAALAELIRRALSGKVAYNRQEAAEAVGLGYDSIKRAVASGRLLEHSPYLDGKTSNKGVILAEDLAAWVRSGPTDRELT